MTTADPHAPLQPTVEVARPGRYGPEAVHVRVPTGRGRSRVLAAPELVEVGDTFRARTSRPRSRRMGHGRGAMTVTVRSFFADGSSAFVDRSTSNRKQPVSTVRLVTDYDRVR